MKHSISPGSLHKTNLKKHFVNDFVHLFKNTYLVFQTFTTMDLDCRVYITNYPGIEISTLHVLYNIVHINRIINLLLASLKGTCGKGAPLCLSQNSSALFNSYSYKTRKIGIIQRIMILSMFVQQSIASAHTGLRLRIKIHSSKI